MPLNQIKLTPEIEQLYYQLVRATSTKSWDEIDKRDLRDLRNWARQLRDTAGLDFNLRTTWFNLKTFIQECLSWIGKLLKSDCTLDYSDWMERYATLAAASAKAPQYRAEISGFPGEKCGWYMNQYVELANLRYADGSPVEGVRYHNQGFKVTKHVKSRSLDVGDSIIFTAGVSAMGHFKHARILEVVRRLPTYHKHEVLRFVRHANNQLVAA